MSLSRIRARIDAIDVEILALLQRRLELAGQTRPYKKRAADPGREREILERIGSLLPGYPGLRGDFVLGLFREILKEGRRVQRGSRRPGDKEEPS